MILKINGNILEGFNQFNVNLKFDAVASTFSFVFYYDPTNPVHTSIFKPGTYPTVTVEHNNSLLLTGTILSTTFTDGSKKELAALGGYSLPGVLEDCNIPTDLYPLQSDGLTLRQIASKLLKKFNLKMEVDSVVASAIDRVFETATADENQSVKAYLATLASQKNIIITHTEKGAVLFTRAKTKQTPVFNYEPGKGLLYGFNLNFGGQQMHSNITVQKQANTGGGNIGVDSINNPYVAAYRPKVVNQTAGDDNTVSATARNALGDELKNISLTAQASQWEVNGQVWKPGQTITVLNPDLGINNPSNWFIQSVNYVGDNTKNTAALTLVLPECYNNETVTNIFN